LNENFEINSRWMLSSKDQVLSRRPHVFQGLIQAFEGLLRT